MPIKNEPRTIYDKGWIIRIRYPSDTINIKALILLHGWTGDENSMWIFARQLPANFLIISPRGLIRANPTGYGWVRQSTGEWPGLAEFDSIASLVMERLINWFKEQRIRIVRFNLMGFSQGAALAHAITVLYPDYIEQTVCLAGFFPQPSAGYLLLPGQLAGHRIFIFHGTKDSVIPTEMVLREAYYLNQAGAEVIYCEEEVGHKLGTSCFNRMEDFLAYERS